MTEQSLDEIEVGSISPSPFQHRRVFDDAGLRELAKSIEQDGLIQPITVRPHEGGYELIAGERRWRAVRKFTALKTIQARVLHVNDLQARRLCATENLQRADLTSLEEVLAMAELVDASMMEFSPEYAPLSPVQEPKWRVKTLLMKLDSDDKHGTNFGNKFVPKAEEIFAGLPKPKDWHTFQKHDLPLLFTPAEVQEFALKHRLNKSQTKAVNEMSKAAPAVFKALADSEQGKIVKEITRMAAPVDAYASQDQDDESVETVADLSAQTIRSATRNHTSEIKPQVLLPINHRAQGTGENEWYTPSEYIGAVRKVLGTIDLDPASSYLANKTVQATRIFSIRDDGLRQDWDGNIWLNPPYSQPHIEDFIRKLVREFSDGRTKQAIALTHNYTDTAWFHHAANNCQAICFTRGRISFVSPSGDKAAPTQGQAFFYFGDAMESFKSAFSEIGFVVVRQ